MNNDGDWSSGWRVRAVWRHSVSGAGWQDKGGRGFRCNRPYFASSGCQRVDSRAPSLARHSRARD